MANINVEVLISAKDQASAVLKKFQNTSESAGAQLSQTFKTGGLAAGIFLGSISALGNTAIQAAADLETMTQGFVTLLGSTEAANKAIAMIKTDAAKTPFELPGLIKANQLLTSVTKDADRSEAMLLNVGKALTAMGRSGAELDNVIFNLQQIANTGKITEIDIRQFGNAGINVVDLLAEHYGTTKDIAVEMVKSSKDAFGDLEKAFARAGEGSGKFAKAFELQGGTFNQLMSNFKDSMMIAGAEIAKQSGAFEAAKKSIASLVEGINILTPKIIELVKFVKENEMIMIGLAGAIAGVLVLAIGALVVTFGTAIAMMAAFAAIGAGVAIQIKNIYDKFQELKAGLEQIVPPIQQFFEELPVRVGETITAIGVWFGQLPGILAATWVKTWTQDVPAAFGFIAGYLSTAIPQLITNIGIWLAGIPPKVQQVFTQFRTDTQARVTETAAWLQAELSSWPGRIYSFIISIPSIVMAVFNSAKNAVLSQMSEMFAGVSGWWDKIKGILNAIRDAANAAIDAVSRGFAAGQKAGGGRQAGGIVPGPRDEPRLILAHGGEEVTPIDKRGTSGGESAGMSFTVNIGLYAGGEIEKRNIARELYASLVQLAAAENKSVAEMMGR